MLGITGEIQLTGFLGLIGIVELPIVVKNRLVNACSIGPVPKHPAKVNAQYNTTEVQQ